MIDDLDKTLEILIQGDLSSIFGEQITISFATPDGDFPPSSVKLPAIDLFLYDIRENRDLRNNEWYIDRHHTGSATKTRSPIRVDCSYLVTAWPSENVHHPAQDEHRLLGEVMRVLLRYRKIPDSLLQASLLGQETSLPTMTLQQGHLQSLGEFWQALGGKPKAALNYTVTIGVDPFEPVESPLVLEKIIGTIPSVEED